MSSIRESNDSDEDSDNGGGNHMQMKVKPVPNNNSWLWWCGGNVASDSSKKTTNQKSNVKYKGNGNKSDYGYGAKQTNSKNHNTGISGGAVNSEASENEANERILLSTTDIKLRGEPSFIVDTLNLHLINFEGNANCVLTLRLVDKEQKQQENHIFTTKSNINTQSSSRPISANATNKSLRAMKNRTLTPPPPDNSNSSHVNSILSPRASAALLSKDSNVNKKPLRSIRSLFKSASIGMETLNNKSSLEDLAYRSALGILMSGLQQQIFNVRIHHLFIIYFHLQYDVVLL